ncbi:SIR2 family protein [Fictibacillus sp. Mic-4]|uniref:SIR2 family protein n=1 Tax=Fictibacillus sp. Mic-4 TaxID=3132826 RepID=UPI002B79B326|nr:SIR2 family protein [Bacillus sp. (in: firmicutes)]
MRVLNIHDSDLYEELIKYHKKNSLIPILGAGFSRGSQAKVGKVPNAKEMINHMKNSLKVTLNESDFNLIQNYNFRELSETYFENCEDREIKKYLNDYFTDVVLSQYQRQFINLNWSHIYTLNIDDAIENNHKNIEVIHPFKEISEFYEENKAEKTHLYKLHGDAREYIKHNQKCILSTSSYLQSLQENRELLSRLISDIKSNCVLYLGCSLDDELDILYQLNLKSGNYNTDLKNTYYVTSSEIENSKIKIQKLKKFGVDTIIKVSDYNDFYSLLQKMDNESTKHSSDEMSLFMNPKFIRTDKGHQNKEKNLQFFINSNQYFNNIENKEIHLPYFLINRDLFNTEENLQKNFFSKNLIIIQGHRYSGKTSALLSLAEMHHNNNIIFISSGNRINTAFLKSLLNEKNITVFLDTGVIDFECWKILKSNVENLINKNIRFVIAVDSSDEFLYQIELLINDQYFKEYIRVNTISNTLTLEETKRINEKLISCVIPEFKLHKNMKFNKRKNQIKTYTPTLLDNVYEILTSQNVTIMLKNIEKMDVDEAKLILLILLATRYRLSYAEIEKYRLDKIVHSFIEDISPVAHFYQTLKLEKNKDDHAGIKLICNSRIWILHNLGKFALDRNNQDLIAKSYKRIVELIIYHYRPYPKKAREEIGKFIKFDDINDIFPKTNKGSLQLIQKIYSNLEDILADNYHFPHQRAKSLSWLNNITELNKAKDYAQVALRKIENTFPNNYESNYSYMHVWYTLATITTKIALINNYQDPPKNIEALNTVYRALSFKENLNYITNDERSNSSKSIREFVKNLSFKCALEKSEQEVLNSLVNLLNSKQVVFK